MRVLYLTPGCFDKGGISRYSRYQIRAARKMLGSDNVRVVSLLGPDSNSIEEPIEVSWHGDAKVSDFSRLRFALRAAALAATWRPSLIHVALVNFTPLVRQIARLCGASTLLNVYGLEMWSDLSPARRRSLYLMDHVIADCHFTADYVAQERMRPTPPTVIWDCVDLDHFRPGDCPQEVRERYGLPAGHGLFVVLTLGRLSREAMHKGYDRLLEVFSRLSQRCSHARLVIGGSGDLQPSLAALAARLGVTEKVRFTGSIHESDLPAVYRSASVFSLVSDRGHRRGEGIPLTPLEAMACGTPIVVGNQDGSSEAVVGKRNGFIVDPFNLEAHASLLHRLATQPSLLDNMRAGAVEVARERFSYARFQEQQRSVYDHLLGAKAGVASLGAVRERPVSTDSPA